MKRLWNKLPNDAHMAVAVCLAAACIGMAQFFQDGGRLPAENRWPAEELGYYRAAVMMAAGKGYHTPSGAVIPESFEQFMAFERTSLPQEELADMTALGMDPFQARHRYLGYAMALTWWLFGLSWYSLKVMLLLFYSVSAVLVYYVLRLGMNRVFSAAGAMCFAMSPIVLSFLMQIRDFSKAPFVLGALLMLALLAARPSSKRRYLRLAAGIGALIGVGLGFRHDVMACIPPALAVLAFCPRAEPRVPVRQRLAGMGVMFLTFIAAGFPVLLSLSHTGNMTYHHTIMGLATANHAQLGMGRASYQLMPCPRDNYAHAVRSNYAVRELGMLPPEPEEPAGAKAGRRFLMAYAATFPGDLVARAYAASLQMLGDTCAEITYVPTVLVQRVLPFFQSAGNHFARYGPAYAAVALLMLAWRSLRLAALGGFLLLYFTAYTSIQFQFRHVFHLTFIPFALFLFVVHQSGAALWRWRHNGARLKRNGALRAGGLRAAAFLAVACLLLGGIFYGARAWQHWRTGRMLARYQAARVERLGVTEVSQNGRVLFAQADRPYPKMPPAWRQHIHGNEVHMDYLMVELATNAPYRQLFIEYEGERPESGYVDMVYAGPTGSGDSGVTRFFFPVYEIFDEECEGCADARRFRGVALEEAYAHEFRGLYRVKNIESFPLLLFVTLPPDSGAFRRYKPLRADPVEMAETILPDNC